LMYLHLSYYSEVSADTDWKKYVEVLNSRKLFQ
jgi:hypothetical protein